MKEELLSLEEEYNLYLRGLYSEMENIKNELGYLGVFEEAFLENNNDIKKELITDATCFLIEAVTVSTFVVSKELLLCLCGVLLSYIPSKKLLELIVSVLKSKVINREIHSVNFDEVVADVEAEYQRLSDDYKEAIEGGVSWYESSKEKLFIKK